MLIGISAKIDCGKTFLANFFLKEHSEYIKLGFGDVLKQECSETYGYPLEWNYIEEGKAKLIWNQAYMFSTSALWPKSYMTVREILQWHGTDYRRKQDEDYWVRKMIDILLEDKIPDTIIIDDVRFLNEANMIKETNGILIRINPYPEWKPGPYANHRSETELDDFEDWDLVLNPAFGKLKECVPLIEKAMKND